MHGEIEIFEDEEKSKKEIQENADLLLYEAQRAGVISLSESHLGNNPSDLVWIVADRLSSLSSTSSSLNSARWIEMTDPIQRMHDVRDALQRHVLENNENDMI